MSPKTSFGTWNFRVKRNKYLQINSGEKEVFKNSIEADKRLVSDKADNSLNSLNSQPHHSDL